MTYILNKDGMAERCPDCGWLGAHHDNCTYGKLPLYNEFKKFDSGKPEFDIISQFDRELGQINQVMKHGATKYGMDNWKRATKDDIRRYRNAAMRHILSSFNSNSDGCSGLPHWAHTITNLLFIAFLERQEIAYLERADLGRNEACQPDNKT